MSGFYYRILAQTIKYISIMKEYQILIVGYKNGYTTSELIKINGLSFEDAAIKAEQKSTLDGAAAKI